MRLGKRFLDSHFVESLKVRLLDGEDKLERVESDMMNALSKMRWMIFLKVNPLQGPKEKVYRNLRSEMSGLMDEYGCGRFSRYFQRRLERLDDGESISLGYDLVH
jgi:hypothetical protein